MIDRDEARPTDEAPQTDLRWFARYSLLLVFACCALGVFATALNHRFYEHHQPFHDSIGYHDKMHEIMSLGREQGVLAAVAYSCQCESTVFVPNLVAALLSRVCEPSRLIGVWIQVFELAFVLISLFYFVVRIKKQTFEIGLLVVAPLFLLAALYRFNGGLSDFRMDLSLCLMFALAMIWYLAAIESQRWIHFAFFGLAAGLACLFRGTAPIYLLVAFGPLVILDALTAKTRLHLIGGMALAAALAIGVSLWFYLLNFDRLYYYYFVWNTHANAALGISESMKHLDFTLDHIGEAALVMIGVFHLVVLRQRFLVNKETATQATEYCRHHQPSGDAFHRLPVVDWINYRLLWLAAVPTSFLILRGAGLNPFVSMPSAVGIVLFLVLPMSLPNVKLSRTSCVFAATVFLGLTCWALRDGWKDHGPRDCNSMAAHQTILNAAIGDASNAGLNRSTITSLHVYSLDARSLRNVVLFDMPAGEMIENKTYCEGVRLHFATRTAPVAQANWQQVEGATEREKLDTIYNHLDQRIQYLVMPNRASAEFAASRASHNVINRYCPELRERILASGNWIAITDEIKNAPHDTVQLFKRVSSTRTAQKGDSARIQK